MQVQAAMHVPTPIARPKPMVDVETAICMAYARPMQAVKAVTSVAKPDRT